MLQRPEIGTRENVLLWLAGKDPKESYQWNYWKECPCALYSRENSHLEWDGADPLNLSDLAGEWPRTWGALHDRARKAWE